MLRDDTLTHPCSTRFVYQKSYMEFFCPPDALDALLAAVKSQPSIAYQVVNAAGDYKSNLE